jgi:hypothetical protein
MVLETRPKCPARLRAIWYAFHITYHSKRCVKKAYQEAMNMTLAWVLIIGVLAVLFLLIIFWLVGFIMGIKWAHTHFQVNSHQPASGRSVRQVLF